MTVEGLRVRGPWHPCRPSPPDSTGESTGTGVTGHSRMPQRAAVAAVKLVGRVGFGGWDRRRRYDFQFHPWTYDALAQVDAWKHVNFVDLQCLSHTYSVKKWRRRRRVGKPLERRRHVNSSL